MNEEELRFRWSQTMPGASLDAGDPGLTYNADSQDTMAMPYQDLARATFSAKATIAPNQPNINQPRQGQNFQEANTLVTGPDQPGSSPLTNSIATRAERASFEFIKELGRGGMGVVYKARQRSLHREVAIKKIISGQSNPIAREKFVAEARVTGQLDHPNIVSVHELAENEQGEILLAMKLVDGMEWKQILHPKNDEEKEKSKKFNKVETEDHLDILFDVCNALKFAHTKKICHLDLKPENVMIGEYGEVLVMDWGISVSYADASNSTDSSLINSLHRSGIRGPRGTPAYMAPELAEGESSQINHLTDIYLLGAILHEILTGHPPHIKKEKGRPETLTQVLLRACESEAPQFDSSIPAELQGICRKAMAKNPLGRYDTVDAFQADLKDYLRHKESTTLSDKAQETLKQCQLKLHSASGTNLSLEERNRLYGDLASSVAAFGNATMLWEENKEAILGREEARASYARGALLCGDLGLAEAQLSELDDNHSDKEDLLEKVLTKKAHRDAAKKSARRTRQGLIAAAVVIIVGLVGGVGLVERERQVAIAAGDAEKAERKKAELAEISARESAELAKQAEKKAKVEEKNAKAAEALARVAEGKALESEKKARAEEELARAAAEKARLARIAEEAQRKKAELLVKEGFLERARIAFKSKDFMAAWVLAEKAVCPELEGSLRTLWLQLKDIPGTPLWARHLASEDKLTSVAFSPDGQSLAVTQTPGKFAKSDGLTGVQQWSIKGERRPSYLGHRGGTRDVAYHPAGRILASVGKDLNVHLWDRQNAQLIAQWRAHSQPITRLCFSPDGKWLATAGRDKLVIVWDIQKKTAVHRFRGHTSTIWCLAFDKKSRYLASTGGNKVHFWPLEGKAPQPIQLNSTISGLALSAKSDSMILAVDDNTIQIWNIQTGRRRLLIRGHTKPVWWVALHPEEKYFASCGADSTIRLWEIATGQLMQTFNAHQDAVARVAFSPDGQKMASVGYDKTVRLWDMKSYKVIDKLKLLGGAKSIDLALHPKKELAAISETESSDGTIKTQLWDLQKKRPIRPLQVSQYMNSLVFSHSGRMIAGSSFWNGQFFLWDSSTGKQLFKTKAGKTPAENPSFSPDDKLVALQYYDKSISVWETTTKALKHKLILRRGSESKRVERDSLTGWSWGAATSFSADGRWLLSAGADKNIIVWDAETGKELYDLQGHRDGVLGLQCHPKNKSVFISSSYDKTLCLWDLSKSKSPIKTISLPIWAYDVAFDSSGSMIVARYADSVGLWSATDGASLLTVDHEKSISDVRLSSDGRFLLISRGSELHLTALDILQKPLASLFDKSEDRTDHYVNGTKVESFCRYCVSGIRFGPCRRCRGVVKEPNQLSIPSQLSQQEEMAKSELALGQRLYKSKSYKQAIGAFQKSAHAWAQVLVLADALGLSKQVEEARAMTRECARFMAECHRQ
ncbi:MAG: protein kinase [Planctomycetota bacterium]|nr:protein kinase [Planctomycetota bacterium]